jgi:hypothetical protein
MVYEARYFKPFAGTTEVIGSGAITSGKIAAGAVGSSELEDDSIQTEDLADKCVTLAKLADDIPAINVVDGSITEPKLDDDSVSLRTIQDGAVTGDKIGNAAVTLNKVADNAVETIKIKDGNVTKPKIAVQSVSPDRLESVDAPADQEIPVYDIATGKFEWKATPTPVGIFVPRNANTFDKTVTDFGTTGSPVTNGLDLSSIVPANAIAVVLRIQVSASAVPGGNFWVRRNSTNAQNKITVVSQVTSLYNETVGIISIDSDRLLDYFRTDANLDAINLAVVGWFV